MQENNGSNEKQGGLSWSTPEKTTPSPKPVAAPVSQKNSSMAPVMSASSANSAKYIGMIVVGIIAGVVVAWAWVALGPSGSMLTKNDALATSTPTGGVTGVGSNAGLTIMSPQAPGKSVAIAKAVVSTPTWVVVYENKEGKPGNALGAALFFPERQTGTVELLRSTVSGKTYLVAKQTDNGDRKFSLKGDQLLSEGGAVQWVTLEVK